MGKIFCIIGKSSTGKDTLFHLLLEDSRLGLKQIVPYTTRPIRVGEIEGENYHFIDENTVESLSADGRIVELRAYHTFHGIWKYMTVDDGTIDIQKHCYLVIGTLESFLAMKKFYGVDAVIPLYIELDDGIRLTRALNREKKQENPKYREMCRRFLADAEDYSDERIEAAGITDRFCNEELHHCKREMLEYILRIMAEDAKVK